VNLELEIQNDRRQYAQMVEHNKAVDVHEQKMVKLKQLHQEFDSVKSVTTEHPELQTEIAKKTTASIAEIDAKIAKTTKTVGEKGLGKAWTNNADELTKAGFKDLAEHTKGARTWAIGAGAAMAVLGTGLTLWQLSESGKAEQASKERQTKLAELRKMDVQA
jgi:phage host-nuclease inhibitor protein Gam